MAQVSTNLLVAAFDIGTTYSGYAFSFMDKPLEVITNQIWIAGSARLVSLKAPTCILLDPKGEVHSFGFEAEDKYSELAEENSNKGWRMFRRFKISLFKNMTVAVKVSDVDGNLMSAKSVFAMTIKFLRQHFLQFLSNSDPILTEEDIKYVVTVPAIWNDEAKRIMRDAAIEAGMNNERLQIALESEVAAVWCKTEREEATTALAGVGTRYMVVDLGGGTADISAYEKQSDGTLREICQANGGPWGGTTVDEEYLHFMEKIFGPTAMEECKKFDFSAYMYLLRDIETQKRTLDGNNSNVITFHIPARLSELTKEKQLKDNIEKIGYGGKVKVRGRDKLKVHQSLVMEWFEPSLKKLTSKIQDMFQNPEVASTSVVLLVGGFSESEYVRTRVKTVVGNRKLIVPNEPGLAVLKGAVQFGHKPNIIKSRKMRYTYGVAGTVPYNSKIHPKSLKCVINGKPKVRNAFIAFMRADEDVTPGTEISKVCCDPGSGEKDIMIPIFRSEYADPLVTTGEDCTEIGTIKFSHSNRQNEAIITFIFGGTEIDVKVRIKDTGEEMYMKLKDCN